MHSPIMREEPGPGRCVIEFVVLMLLLLPGCCTLGNIL